MTRSNRYGRPGPDGPATAALVEWWSKSAERQHTHPGPGEWVPVNAIQVDLSILPRTRVDEDTVQRYRDAFLDLPPIVVQRDTFTLIGGLHRMSAAQGVSDYIRIVEKDIADADLEDAALEDNRLHGLPLNAAERKYAAQKMFRRHHPDTGGTSGVAWPVAEIVRLSGMQRDTIEGWARSDRRNEAESRARDTSAGILHKPSLTSSPEASRTSSPEADGIAADDGVPFVDLDTGEIGAPPQPAVVARVQRQPSARPITYTAVGDVGGTREDGSDAASRLWEALLAAVQGINERDPDEMLADATPAQAADARRLAERMVAYWGRVADAALLRETEAEEAP